MDITTPQTIATTSFGCSKVEPPNGVQPNSFTKQYAPPLTEGAPNYHHPLPIIGFAHGKCNKNYAARIGGNVLDGCGEFMPSFTSTPSDPTFLYCDACGCHRSFHHETNHYYPPYHHVIEYQFPPHHLYDPQHTTPPSAMNESTPSSPPPSPISSHYPPGPNMHLSINHAHPGSHHGMKRVRTKFSENQKENMTKFAQTIGWKMVKNDKETIHGFCNDIGVTERAFKVWMNNHKNLTNENNHP